MTTSAGGSGAAPVANAHLVWIAPESGEAVPTSGAPRPAVFVDRDGTLTREGEWIVHPGALELVPGAGAALRRLNQAGFPVVMYTNQSAVARGMIDARELEHIHAGLRAMLARDGAHLDAIYSCPHHPTEGVGAYRVACACRKPAPGLLLAAARDLALDLSRSWCVGDMARDLDAGAAVGARGILVATGKGATERARVPTDRTPVPLFVADFPAAVEIVLARRESVRSRS